MQDSSKSATRALGAVADAAQLIELAQGAVERARVEFQGDAQGVADRLSQQLYFLRKVADVLRHEIERVERDRTPVLTSGPPAIRDRSSG